MYLFSSFSNYPLHVLCVLLINPVIKNVMLSHPWKKTYNWPPSSTSEHYSTHLPVFPQRLPHKWPHFQRNISTTLNLSLTIFIARLLFPFPNPLNIYKPSLPWHTTLTFNIYGPTSVLQWAGHSQRVLHKSMSKTPPTAQVPSTRTTLYQHLRMDSLPEKRA